MANPPYSSGVITRFVNKLLAELENITQCIFLVNNATETKWFSRLVKKCSAVCFPQGRIKFQAPDGKMTNAPMQGQAIFYFGEHTEKFITEFKNLGWCALPKK